MNQKTNEEELEYRKPKEVKKVSARGMHMHALCFYRCPTCGKHIETDFLYCANCGQMLDWGEK